MNTCGPPAYAEAEGEHDNYQDRREASVIDETKLSSEKDLEKTRPAARATGLSASYLYKHAHEIPAAHRAGRALRWDILALRAWMRQQAAARGNGME